MACLTDFFKRVSVEEHIAASFVPREPRQKTAKRPVGRPRKRPLQSDVDGQTHTAQDNVQPASADGEEPTNDKSIRRQYTAKQKKRVVQYARHHGVRPAERKFGVPRKNIQRWLKSFLDGDFVQGIAKRGPKKQRIWRGRQKAGRKLSYPKEIDDKLLEWVLCLRERHLALSTQMLRDKALALIKEHNANFKASEGWARKFIRRHSLELRARTSVAQKLPGDLEDKVSAFQEEVKTERQKHDFPKELIGNMDETPLYFDMVPSRTIEKKGAKEVRVRSTGAEKRRVTVVLACTASGKTLPPMIIFKGKTPRVIKGLKAPPGFVLAFQKKAWMTAVLMRQWTKEIWLKHTKNQKSLLTLDHFKGHLDDEVKKDLQAGNSVSVVIPGGCTSVVQPLDVSLNKPFKGHVRVEWLAFMEKSVMELEKQQEEEEELSDDPFASSDEDDSNDEIQRLLSRKPKPIVVKPASKQSIIDWVASAWKKIEQQPDMVAKSFVVTGIAQDLDGSENGSIRNADVQDEISAKLDNPQDTDSDLSSSDSSSDEDSDA